LFDAMPAFWKYMPAKQRRLVVALMNDFYEKAKDEGENANPWILNNVFKLIKHVALENIQQLHGCCYLTTKIDPTVLIDPDPGQRGSRRASFATTTLVGSHEFILSH
jgi:hypothetical protein